MQNTVTEEASSVVEPFIGMEFESEEAAKSLYGIECNKTFQDEKDTKIRELDSTELSRERKRCAALQQQLDMVLNLMEEHTNHLSFNINNVTQNVRK